MRSFAPNLVCIMFVSKESDLDDLNIFMGVTIPKHRGDGRLMEAIRSKRYLQQKRDRLSSLYQTDQGLGGRAASVLRHSRSLLLKRQVLLLCELFMYTNY